MSVHWSKDPDMVRFARGLWESGLSVRLVADRCSLEWHINVSKNAIIGVSHRKQWGARPSPIIRYSVSSCRPAVCPPPGGYDHLPRLPSLAPEDLPDAPVSSAAIVAAHDDPEPEPEMISECPSRTVRGLGEEIRRSDGTGCLAVNPSEPDERGRTKWISCDRPLYSIRLPYCEDCARHYYLSRKKKEEFYAQDC